MFSSAGVSIRWYPNCRYTATIDSSTWSRTATSAGSKSRIPLAGLLSIFMMPSCTYGAGYRAARSGPCKWYGRLPRARAPRQDQGAGLEG